MSAASEEVEFADVCDRRVRIDLLADAHVELEREIDRGSGGYVIASDTGHPWRYTERRGWKWGMCPLLRGAVASQGAGGRGQKLYSPLWRGKEICGGSVWG